MTHVESPPTDWRGLCAEPLRELQNTIAVHYGEGGTHHISAADAVIVKADSALAQPEPEVVGPSDEEIIAFWSEHCAGDGDAGIIRLARFGGRPSPAPAGDVGELVVWLRSERHLEPRHYARLTRAADLLEQRQAAPVPVPSDTRYEFSVYDEDYTEQAGGSAPSYAQALSEGQRYLAQYQQDGPHTLEVRRVENLNPGAFPVPDDAPVPVPTSERLPELRGMFERILCVARSGEGKPVGNIELADRLIRAVVSWGALPLPSGEVE